MTRVSAVAAAFLFGVVALFQVAMVLGAPWGDWTQGGAVSGTVPAAGRVVAAIAAVLLVCMALVILGVVGSGPFQELKVLRVFGWLTVVYCAANVVLNLISESARERALWTPVTLLLLVLSLTVMLRTREE